MSTTRQVALTPAGGWDTFNDTEEVTELAWEVLAGWHYMNPTAKTSVWESPSGATFYLAFDDAGALVEAAANHARDEDPELSALLRRLAKRHGLR